MSFTLSNYLITDRAPVLIGYEGENLSRTLTVETADDLSGFASIKLAVGDVDCGTMTITAGDPTEITISLTKSMLGKAGFKKAQLVMLDSGGNVVQKSNQFDVIVGTSNSPRFYAAGEEVDVVVANIDGRSRQIFLPAGFTFSVKGDLSVDKIAFRAPVSYGDFSFADAACRVEWIGVDGVKHSNLCTETDSDGNWVWTIPSALTRSASGEIGLSVAYVITDENDAVTDEWTTCLTRYWHQESAYSDDPAEEEEDATTYDRLASAILAVRNAQASIDDINTILSSLTSSSPTVVSTVADLANVDTSEYQLAIVAANSYLYYYDGSDWQPGFEYGALQEIIDARTDEDGTTHTDLQTRINAGFTEVKEDLLTIRAAINELYGGVPTDVRQAISTILNNNAFKTNAGFRSALAIVEAWAAYTSAIVLDQSAITISGASTVQLTATTTPAGNTVSWASSDASVATVDSNGLVTGTGNGTATITATSGDVSATCTAIVSGFASITAITATFAQGDNVIGTDDTLDDLEQYLTVTATYSDSTTATVTGYTLSGTLTEGTSTITVTYGELTDTFTVNVSVRGWLYRFNGSLASDGTEDFSLSGVENYVTGVNDKAYFHEVATEGTASTDPLGLSATGLSRVPDMSGDFTVSFWHKSVSEIRGHAFVATKYETGNSELLAHVTMDDADWTDTIASWPLTNTLSNSYRGCRQVYIGQKMSISFSTTSGKVLYALLQLPDSIDTREWHHIAFSRKDGVLRFFFDGSLIWHVSTTAEFYFPDQIFVGNNSGSTSETAASAAQTEYSDYVDDLYIAEIGKWDAAFDTSAIVY